MLGGYGSHDVPHILGSVAELAAGYTGRKREVANGDLLIDHRVCECVGTLGHGTNEDADALLRIDGLDIVAHTNEGCVKAEGDLATIRRQMLRDWTLDHTQELLVRVGGADGHAV